ncbi:MAG: hypothetical protein RSB41_01885, partial [Bacilli bacterium]
MLPQMLWYEWLISYIGVLICSFVIAHVYKIISNNSKVSVFCSRSIIVILLSSFLIMLNSIINYNITRLLIQILLLIAMNIIIYKDKLSKSIIITIMIYIVICIFEMLCSSILIVFDIKTAVKANSTILIKTLLSTLVILATLMFFEIKTIKNLFNKLSKSISNNKTLNVFT